MKSIDRMIQALKQAERFGTLQSETQVLRQGVEELGKFRAYFGPFDEAQTRLGADLEELKKFRDLFGPYDASMKEAAKKPDTGESAKKNQP